MKVIKLYPPNIEEIQKKFDVKGKKIIYSWGDKIYSPHPDFIITPELFTHERVHSLNQTNIEKNIILWWEKYLDDVEFRLREELLAHIAEYKHHCLSTNDRNVRNRYLNMVSMKLSSPIYGNMISQNQARKLINSKV
jgi:hypothetical protein